MKRGGSKMGYTEQFNLLSPCYKEGEQPAGWHMGGVKSVKKGKATKKGTTAKPKKTNTKTKSKQRGGSSCGASPSVSEMGIVDKPASLEPTKSELAWDNRMKGGSPNGVNSTNVSANIPIISTNNSSKSKNVSNLANNKINNISTYLNKLKGVVFDGNTQNGFAIVVERTTEDTSNSKNDRYSIKVIEQLNNTPTMSVLSDQTYSAISQTVRDTSSKVFPLKKTNNKQPVSMNISTNTSNLTKKNVPQSVNNSISNANANPKINNKNAAAAAAANPNMFS